MAKPKNDRNQPVTKFCLAMEEHRRSEAGRVRTAKEFVAHFFPYDTKQSTDRLFCHIPQEVRGPVLSAWGIRGAKAAIRDDDEKVRFVVHDALVAGDIDEATFEEGVNSPLLIDWVALPDWWNFWRQGKLTGVAIQRALATARELALIDDRWFLQNIQGRGGKLKGTDVVCDTLSKDQIVAWMRRIHETGDGSPAGLITAVGWETVLVKTAQDALLFALDAFARKAGLVEDTPEKAIDALEVTSSVARSMPAAAAPAPAPAPAPSPIIASAVPAAATFSAAPVVISPAPAPTVSAPPGAVPAPTVSAPPAPVPAVPATAAPVAAAPASVPPPRPSKTTPPRPSSAPQSTRPDREGHPTVNAPHDVVAAAEAEAVQAALSRATGGPPITSAEIDAALKIPSETVGPWRGDEESPKLAEARAAMMATLMHSNATGSLEQPHEPWDESDVPAKPSSLEWPEPPIVVGSLSPDTSTAALGTTDELIPIEEEDLGAAVAPKISVPGPPPVPKRGGGTSRPS